MGVAFVDDFDGCRLLGCCAFNLDSGARTTVKLLPVFLIEHLFGAVEVFLGLETGQGRDSDQFTVRLRIALSIGVLLT